MRRGNTADPGEIANNLQELMDASPMGPRQVIIIALAVALNALDGLDVLTISFAAPLISREWRLGPGELGIVLSMELVGMMLGSLMLGNLADRYGRRPLVLGSLVLMATGAVLTALTSSILSLGLCRILTGVGIGGMVPIVTTVAVEFSNKRRRNLCLALVVIGYSVGAVLGGLAISFLLKSGEWRSIFIFASVTTATLLPVVMIALPESISFLAADGALGRVNVILRRLGLPSVQSLSVVPEKSAKPSLASLFAPGMAGTSLIVTFAFVGQIITFYFVMKWTATIVTDLGFDAATAARILVLVNVGGMVGGMGFGLLAQRYDIYRLTIASLLLSFSAVCLFGLGSHNILVLAACAAVAGIFINTNVVGLYSVLARTFPAHLRATGTGFAAGVGRGGAIASPILAGWLFASGMTAPRVAFLMASGTVIAAGLLLALHLGGPARHKASSASSSNEVIGD